MFGQSVERKTVVVNLLSRSHGIILNRLVGATYSGVEYIIHIFRGGGTAAGEQGEARVRRVLLYLFLAQRILG